MPGRAFAPDEGTGQTLGGPLGLNPVMPGRAFAPVIDQLLALGATLVSIP